jgi:hypothetical protein
MSELQDAGRMIEVAEQAAIADDLASADELLRGAARIQEAELGPLHPDLANTLNNLAVIAEKAGRLDDAEAFYRRSVAIASASLAADDPMIAVSRQNLEDFCTAHGLPIDPPALIPPSPHETAAGLDVFAPEGAADAADTPAGDLGAADAGLTLQAAPPPPGSRWRTPREPTPTASESLAPSPPQVSPSLAWVAAGVAVFLVTAALFVWRPWSSRETSTQPPAPETTLPPPAAGRALPPPAEPGATSVPLERDRPSAAPKTDNRAVPTDTPPVPSPAPGAITVATAQLCRTFSASGASWRCDPTVEPVSRGTIVFYTRVRAPRDAVVEHRWYRQDKLRQSVKLTIRASGTEGYRTYSRQTVDGGAEWRVEVRSAKDDLLYERRFDVR